MNPLLSYYLETGKSKRQESKGLARFIEECSRNKRLDAFLSATSLAGGVCELGSPQDTNNQ